MLLLLLLLLWWCGWRWFHQNNNAAAAWPRKLGEDLAETSEEYEQSHYQPCPGHQHTSHSADAICGWLSKDHQVTRTKSNLYLWRKWAILKCPYMDITVPEKRSASVQGVLPSAQRPTHREEAEPPRLQNGDINISPPARAAPTQETAEALP